MALTCKHIWVDTHGTTDRTHCGVSVASSDVFDNTVHAERNMLQWYNPNTTSVGRNIFCGIYARSFATSSTMSPGQANVKCGMVFRTRDRDTFHTTLAISPVAGVGIGVETPQHALDVNGNISCTGTFTGTVQTSCISSFSASHIPSLDVSKFAASGVFDTSRIPSLDISTHLHNSVLDVSRIPSLNVSKITSGVLSTARFSAFTDGQVTAGAFHIDRIPSLPASSLSTGAFQRLFDTRALAPSNVPNGFWMVGFGSWANSNTSPFADVLHLNNWGDSSGGKTNAVMFRKDAIGMRIYQGTYASSTAYALADAMDVVTVPASGALDVTGTSNNVAAFSVSLPSDLHSSWRTFNIRATSRWGNGITTYSEANVYTTGNRYVTIDSSVMYRHMHVVADGGGTARMRIGKAGGVNGGNWWEIGTMTNGEYVIASQASGTNRVRFTTDGGMVANGDVTAFSDERLKCDIETIPASSAIAGLKKIRGVTYDKGGKRGMGVIAQEVREAFPEVVHEGEDGMLSVAYGNLVAVLIEVVKEQRRQRRELRQRVEGV